MLSFINLQREGINWRLHWRSHHLFPIVVIIATVNRKGIGGACCFQATDGTKFKSTAYRNPKFHKIMAQLTFCAENS